MKSVVCSIIFALMGSLSVYGADKLPKNANQYLPDLVVAKNETFSTFAHPEYFAGQVEQESCISLTHPKCWNPRAELKTKREYGFGFGQTTIAYNANGTERFNNFEAAKKLHPSLAQWKWDERFDPTKQLMVMLLMDKQCYTKSSKWAASDYENTAFMFSCYNGGYGGIITDRKICERVRGCDPSKWFGNVEKYSLKQKTKIPGYGKSMFEINREYPKNIMFVRSNKYAPFFE